MSSNIFGMVEPAVSIDSSRLVLQDTGELKSYYVVCGFYANLNPNNWPKVDQQGHPATQPGSQPASQTASQPASQPGLKDFLAGWLVG
jgi:hypothetical protein